MISGVVLHLALEERLRRQTLQQIEEHSCIELGACHANRAAIVIETPSAGPSRDVTDWLLSLPGVTHLDVTYVDFEDFTTPHVEVESKRNEQETP